MPANTGSDPFESIGLGRAIKEFPSLAAPVLISYALLAALVPHVPIVRELAPIALQPLLFVLATVLGLIQFTLSDYWDRNYFDPRYSYKREPEGGGGTWAERKEPPLHVFPPGDPLNKARFDWDKRSNATSSGY